MSETIEDERDESKMHDQSTFVDEADADSSEGEMAKDKKKPYEILELINVDSRVTFIRTQITNRKEVLLFVLSSISDETWLSRFSQNVALMKSYRRRLEITARDIEEKFSKEKESEITKISGEKVVSELARKSVIESLKYADIPLGEVLKEMKTGNPGFDFFSESIDGIPLFGEAKYVNGSNAYGKALKQILEFVEEYKDEADFANINEFISKVGREKMGKGIRGVMAGFSALSTPSADLIDGIKRNIHYQAINLKSSEIILVAINV